MSSDPIKTTALCATGWAVFAPSNAISWRSIETSRGASLVAFAGEMARWPDFEAAGYKCVPVNIMQGDAESHG